jgi:hypothetical protein
MYDSSRGSSFCAGRSAGWEFLLAGTFGILVACGSDESAPQTGVGGSREITASADAGRLLPGEGFEPTPAFDITNPQRPVPPREQLVEGVANLNGGGSGGGSSAPDGGADADAGADASGTP